MLTRAEITERKPNACLYSLDTNDKNGPSFSTRPAPKNSKLKSVVKVLGITLKDTSFFGIRSQNFRKTGEMTPLPVGIMTGFLSRKPSGQFLLEHLHLPVDHRLGNLRIGLRRGDALMFQYLRERFQRHAVHQADRRGIGMARRAEGQPFVDAAYGGDTLQGTIHRIRCGMNAKSRMSL